MTNEQLRAEFEAYYHDHYLDDDDMKQRWIGWQARANSPQPNEADVVEVMISVLLKYRDLSSEGIESLIKDEGANGVILSIGSPYDCAKQEAQAALRALIDAGYQITKRG